MTGLEYFYSAHLGYSYLGSALFMETSWAANRPITYRPIDLCWPRDGDNPGPTNGLTPARRDYFSGHEIALSNGMLIAGLLQGVNIDQLAHCQLQGYWRNDADLADGPTLARLGAQAGIDPTPFLAAARSGRSRPSTRKIPRRQSNAPYSARLLNFVDGDMFYGQGHLEMEERALARLFAGIWPPS